MSGPSREQASACHSSSDQPLIAREDISTVASSQQASKASNSAAQSFRIASVAPLLVAAVAILATAAFSLGPPPSSSGASPPPTDPVVTVEKLDDRATVTTATFAPRVRGNDYPEFSHDFTFRNSRDAEIVIEKTNKSCGCLTASIDKMTLAPGEAATISLAVKPHNLVHRPGSLTLHTNAGESHTYRLDTWCYPVVMLDDPASNVISLGSLAPGNKISVTRTVWVHALASGTPPTLSCNDISADPHVKYSLADGGMESFHDGQIRRRKYTLTIDVTPEGEQGLQTRRLSFSPVALHDQNYSFSCDLAWTVHSSVTATPARWVVGKADLAGNETISQPFILQAATPTPIAISAVDCSHPFLSATRGSKDFDSSQRLTVFVDSTGMPSKGAVLGTVTIHFTSAAPEQLTSGTLTVPIVIPKR